MTSLAQFAFQNCLYLNGTIPDSVTLMTRLTYFDVSGNMLSGTVPGGIGALTGLVYLRLAPSLLTGTLPSSIGALRQLRYVFLDAGARRCLPIGHLSSTCMLGALYSPENSTSKARNL